MPTPILMPALSPTMEKGNLAKWHVKEGDTVAAGDVIAEIETDKATMEVEAVDEGTVGKLLVAEGAEDVAVNVAIAVLLEEGEDAGALAGFEAGGAPAPSAPADSAPAPQSAAAPAPAAAPAAAPPAARTNGGGGRIFASPLARRLAIQGGLDLAAISGTGPHGRIVKRDVEKALASGTAAAAPATAPGAPQAAVAPGAGTAIAPAPVPDLSVYFEPGSYDAIPLDKMRKTIARRLTEAKRDIPHYYLTIDCEIDELLALRKKLNARTDQYKISVNDFVIRAAALALKRVPDANATWAESHILRHHHADISVAVAIEGGLITPIIRKADTKGLAEIALEAKDLAARARDRKLAPDEYEGGSFSISNLGMFGVRNFTAVINPPQAAIMAVGGGEQRPVVRDGELTTATMMTVTLSCDHRVIDGALGAELLAAFKGFIEEPLTMLL